MPVPCTECMLWNARRRASDREVVCKMDSGYGRCGEYIRRGLTGCDGGGLEDSDCPLPSYF